jgi:hypothetical protein
MVGRGEIFQHIPLTVTSEPPSSATCPPTTAEVEVNDTTVVVVNVGNSGPGSGQPNSNREAELNRIKGFSQIEFLLFMMWDY